MRSRTRLLAATKLGQLLRDPDCLCAYVNVRAAKRGQLAPSEAAENGEQDAAKRQGRARRGALSYAARSISLLQRRQPDQAGSEALHVLDLAAQISSSRANETIRDLRRRFRGHEDVPEVAEFAERAHAEFGVAA